MVLTARLRWRPCRHLRKVGPNTGLLLGVLRFVRHLMLLLAKMKPLMRLVTRFTL